MNEKMSFKYSCFIIKELRAWRNCTTADWLIQPCVQIGFLTLLVSSYLLRVKMGIQILDRSTHRVRFLFYF
jgi:hypothetical protein